MKHNDGATLMGIISIVFILCMALGIVGAGYYAARIGDPNPPDDSSQCWTYVTSSGQPFVYYNPTSSSVLIKRQYIPCPTSTNQ